MISCLELDMITIMDKEKRIIFSKEGGNGLMVHTDKDMKQCDCYFPCLNCLLLPSCFS